MVSLRKCLVIASLGFLIDSAYAQDTGQDTGYTLEQSEDITQKFLSKVEILTNNDYQEGIKYQGAMVLVIDNICNGNPYAGRDVIEFQVNLNLQERLKNERVNDLPIKFSYFNICDEGTRVIQVVSPFEIRLLKEGLLVDGFIGAQRSVDRIPNQTEEESAWISTNLLGKPFDYKGRRVRWRYDSGSEIKAVPF